MTLPGVTILVSKKLQDLKEELFAIVSSLGGSFKEQYSSEEITHFIFSGPKNDRTKDFQSAKKDGKFIVSPDWIFVSRDEGQKMDEEIFPHTFSIQKRSNLLNRTQNQSQSQSTTILQEKREKKLFRMTLTSVNETPQRQEVSEVQSMSQLPVAWKDPEEEEEKKILKAKSETSIEGNLTF